jgi:hypothetical protein
MEFTVLKAHGADAERWLRLVERLEPLYRDIHFLPQYLRIYEQSQGVSPRLAYYGDGESYVIQPYVVRPLTRLPFIEQAGLQCSDIASVYGYGGPVWRAHADAAESLFASFDCHFREHCKVEQYASEFCCLHPLLANRAMAATSSSIAPTMEKSVVVIDLRLDEGALWSQLNRGKKSGVNKARRSGVTIRQVEPDAANLKCFSSLYRATMARHNAAPKWHFEPPHFAACVSELGETRTALFFAETGGDVAAAALVLLGETVAYYHYAGSDSRYSALRPANLLVYETALWAKRLGRLCYHLGGGLSANTEDTLARFKSGFSPEARPLYVYGRIHDETTYNVLCELKREHEKKTAATVIEPNYFPFYRR